METIAELRKALKAIGFKVKTEKMSWGRHATYQDLEGNTLPFIYHGDGVYSNAHWEPLNAFLLGNKTHLRELGKKENITGLQIH